jgi:hypothetical protein
MGLARTRAKMRRLTGLLLVIGGVVGAGAPVSAAILSLKSSTLELRISAACSTVSNDCATGSVLPLITMAQSPASISVAVNDLSGGFTLPAGLFGTTAAYKTPTTAFQDLTVPMITSLNITAVNAGGSVTSRGGPALSVGGAMPLSGFMRLGLLGMQPVPVNLAALGQDAQTAVVVGQLSIFMDGGNFGAGAARVSGIVTTLTRETPSDTVGCAPLLCGSGFGLITTTFTIGGVTFSSFKTATFVELSGFDNRTAGHVGSLRLVSPVSIVVSGNDIVTFPGFLTATLHFVPEPGTLTLFVSAAAGFFALGLRRRSRR